VSKRIVGNVLKYALAIGLLVLVVWSNWGKSGKVAGRVVVGDGASISDTDKPAVTGTVVAVSPGESITIEEQTAEANPGPTTFTLLKPNPIPLLGRMFPSTKVQGADGLDGLAVGQTVAVWESPPGLAYVWQKHVVQGQPIQYGYLLLAGTILTLAILLTFVRWYFLVRAQDLPFRPSDALRLGFIGFFFNTLMPGSVGGDIIKAAFLAREQDRRTVAVATVIMDRAIALWALVWFVAICGCLFWAGGFLEGPGQGPSLFIIRTALAIVGVTLAVWILLGFLPEHRAERFAGRLLRLPKVGPAAAEFWRAVWMYRCRQRSVAGCMLISWVGHVGFVLAFYFAALTLWTPSDPAQKIPTLWQHFLIVPIGLVINAMPFFPGGAGIGELGFGMLYKWLGASVTSGVLASLVYRVLMWLLGIAGYFVYHRMRRGLVPTKSTAPELAAAWSHVAAPRTSSIELRPPLAAETSVEERLKHAQPGAEVLDD
jgi:hypothetical protein